MANTTIKTKILLRNDTLANWQTSELSLGKGEVAIATLDDGLAEVRVGTGTSTWADSLKLNVSPEQISGLVEAIQGTAKKYQVVSDGDNSWKLQEAALSGGSWTDVAKSGWSVDFSAIDTAIEGLTADVAYISSELSDAMMASDFAALSNEIGLSAATASNKVVTHDEIAGLAGAMHFVGPISLNDGESIADAVARLYPDHTAAGGDIVIDIATSKEYLYTGSTWIELGDEVLYATKAEVAALSDTYATKTEVEDVSAALSTDYVGKISDAQTALEGTVAATSAEAIVSANAYTDEAIAGLSIGDYATKVELAEVSGVLYNDISTIAADYLTSSDKTEIEGTIASTSAEAIASANAYTDEAIAGLSIGNYYTKSETSSATEIDTALQGKSKTSVAQTYSGALSQVDLSVIKVTDADLADYAAALDAGTLNPNAVYVMDLSAKNAFGQKIVNVANGENDTDAATYGQLTALSAATGSYVDNSISAALSALSVDDAGTGFVTVVTQTDGKIAVEKKEIALSDITDADEISSAIDLSSYIKHGEVTQDDLSGVFVFDCGNSSAD